MLVPSMATDCSSSARARLTNSEKGSCTTTLSAPPPRPPRPPSGQMRMSTYSTAGMMRDRRTAGRVVGRGGSLGVLVLKAVGKGRHVWPHRHGVSSAERRRLWRAPARLNATFSGVCSLAWLPRDVSQLHRLPRLGPLGPPPSVLLAEGTTPANLRRALLLLLAAAAGDHHLLTARCCWLLQSAERLLAESARQEAREDCVQLSAGCPAPQQQEEAPCWCCNSSAPPRSAGCWW